MRSVRESAPSPIPAQSSQRVVAMPFRLMRIVVVTMILVKRVGAPVARTAYEDHSPEPPPQLAAAPPRRDRGSGRPTKRERRALDRLRGRDERLRLLEDDSEDE